jgi:N-acetyl-anhydromuramyl-L-alanine amidase AmpD
MTGWIAGYDRYPDDNFSGREGDKPEGIVIHATAGGDGQKTAKWAAAAELSRSWHFLGYRNGGGCQQVPLEGAAWHAGRSRWFRPRVNPNRYTIGIELANHLLLEERGGDFFYELGGRLWPYRGPTPIKAALTFPNGYRVEGYWERYQEAQLAWLTRLLDNLESAGVPRRLIGHEEIRFPEGTKLDPGPLFPWHRFGRSADQLATTAEILEPV